MEADHERQGTAQGSGRPHPGHGRLGAAGYSSGQPLALNPKDLAVSGRSFQAPEGSVPLSSFPVSQVSYQMMCAPAPIARCIAGGVSSGLVGNFSGGEGLKQCGACC
jgi:hypothetical protein